MAIMNQTCPLFTFLNVNHISILSPNPSFSANTQRFNLLSLSATPSSSSIRSSSSASTPSIFLQFLEEEKEQAENSSLEEERELEQSEKFPDDPIYKFFKSRTSTHDPPRESKLTLQRNRRTAWHLAADMEENEPEIEFEPKGEELEDKNEMGLDERAAIESIVGEVMEIARNLPENSTLGEQLKGYEGRVGEAECVEVLSLMIDEGLMMCCLYFFEWMGLQEPSLVTPRACTVLFPALGKACMGDKLMILWRNLPNTWEFRDVHVYNAAMSGLLCSGRSVDAYRDILYCTELGIHAGEDILRISVFPDSYKDIYCRYQDAWKVYEAMETNNILPDRVTGSTMITVMRKEGKCATDAWAFFERMNRKGVNWSLEVVAALIKTFCDERLLKQALIIQEEMEKKGISSNTIVYNTLMDAHCKSNMLEEAEALFVEMETKGLSPSTATYNILMDAYSKRMQPKIVEDLLEELQNTGLEPNVISYTSLISAYGRQKRMSDMAADAFLRMKKAGIKPTSHSYTALIHAYSVSGWHEKAYKAFENMRREGIQPSIETYTALLDAFRRAGDTQTLKEIWKSMIREKVEGTRVTFNILLDGFAKQGHYVEARDVICEFGKIGYPPTVMTYNMLINAYARGGQHLKLPQLLKEMVALTLKPDSVTYSTMIYAFVRVRDFKRAFYYHKQMVKNGQVPDVESYRKLRAILDVKAAVKNKKDKSAILGIVNSKMGMLKAKKKGKKDEFWKNKKKTVRFHNPDHVGL